jgi:hypothetical protein
MIINSNASNVPWVDGNVIALMKFVLHQCKKQSPDQAANLSGLLVSSWRKHVLTGAYINDEFLKLT